jgi:hypothetical protein
MGGDELLCKQTNEQEKVLRKPLEIVPNGESNGRSAETARKKKTKKND